MSGIEGNTSCEIPVEVSQKSTQDLIDSILKDDRINENDRAELQQLLLRKETEINLVQSITHKDLRLFMENEGKGNDWFMTKNECDLKSAILNDMKRDDYGDAENNIQELLRIAGKDVLGISQRDIQYRIIQDGKKYISATQGKQQVLLRLSDLSIHLSDQEWKSINTERTIEHAGEVYMEVINDTQKKYYISVSGKELEFDDNLRVDITSSIEYNGKTYILAKDTIESESILVDPDGKRLFDGYGIDTINVSLGVLSYDGDEYFSIVKDGESYLMSVSGKTVLQGEGLKNIVEYKIENGDIIVTSQYEGKRTEKIFLQGGGVTSQIEQVKSNQTILIDGVSYQIDIKNGVVEFTTEDGSFKEIKWDFSQLDVSKIKKFEGEICYPAIWEGINVYYSPYGNQSVRDLDGNIMEIKTK